MKKRSFMLTLKMADFLIRINSEIDLDRFRDIKMLSDFRSEVNTAADCRLFLKFGLPRTPKKRKLIFSPSKNWKFFKTDKAFHVEVGTPYRNGEPDEVIVLSHDYARGYVYKRHIVELSRYFLDQFLLINLLSRHNGFMLHASGLIWQGKGLVFSGYSGSGKSTLLKLFSSKVNKVALLNDDRIAVRKFGSKWKIYGTPWHGELPCVSSASAPLKAIYFIKHSTKNYLKLLPSSEIACTLFKHSLLPYWDEKSMGNIFETFNILTREIPAYELGVVPDQSIVDFIILKL